jgi:Lon protease-like protein
MLKRYHTITELPNIIPVFPLAGALLLPRAELPLNIFEPRYLALFNDAMAGNRLVGMIQPESDDKNDAPSLSRVGCLGRVTAFAETEDNRLLITLMGICRFERGAELVTETPYRQLEVAYHGFAADLVADNQTRSVNRDALLAAFRQYLEANSMTANWEEVEQVSTEHLVNTLSQLAPYPAAEKQALLEAPDLPARADMLIALTELALSRSAGQRGKTLQ